MTDAQAALGQLAASVPASASDIKQQEAISRVGNVSSSSNSSNENGDNVPQRYPVKWYRSTYYNAVILGLCNFGCPGIWGAMNSLGGGGEESPGLVNAANALTFSLMVLTCALGSVVVKRIGVRATLVLGAAGYAPFAAGLYCNNRWQTEWFLLFGAAVCGLGAGLFWMAEAAIALTYPEPENQGRFLGLWMTFRIGGQVLGGAVNLGLNARRSTAGSVSYSVFEVFIAIQAAAPFIGLLLTPPAKVQRSDGATVVCTVPGRRSDLAELAAAARLLVGRDFLLLVPLIAQAVFAESVYFTFQALWFSVRARALASFVSGLVAMLSGNVLGAFLDRAAPADAVRARIAFAVIMLLQGGWWVWGTVIVTEYRRTRPVFDWTDDGFGRGWSWFLFMVMGFQLNYMYLYFLIKSLARNGADVVRYAGLLRGTESAVQAVSYGLDSIPIMGEVGCVYINFGLWGLALLPAWLVIRGIGVSKVDVEQQAVDDGNDDGLMSGKIEGETEGGKQ